MVGGLDKAIDNEVKGWIPCQVSTSYKAKEPLFMTETPERPWQ